MRRLIFIAGITAAMATGCASTGRVREIPVAMKLDPFYTQYVDAHGVPVTGSRKVAPEALLRARAIIDEMLAHRPDVRATLIRLGARVVIMAESESTTDLPEQRDWKKPTRDDPVLTFCERKEYDETIGRQTDKEYWDGRARGMGGLLTSGAEENLLGRPGTRYFGENIFVHEFSHEIMSGLEEADPAVFANIRAAYAAAKASGLWRGEYAETTAEEYWAEGTQFWFESNKIAVVGDLRILSYDDLKAYDPRLFDLLARVYGHRHRLHADAFWRSPARIPQGGPPASTAEVC